MAQSTQETVDALLSAAVTSVKASNSLAGQGDHGFLATYPLWVEKAEEASTTCLRLLAILQSRIGHSDTLESEEMEDLGESNAFLPFAETIDTLLDRAVASVSADQPRAPAAAVARR